MASPTDPGIGLPHWLKVREQWAPHPCPEKQEASTFGSFADKLLRRNSAQKNPATLSSSASSLSSILSLPSHASSVQSESPLTTPEIQESSSQRPMAMDGLSPISPSLESPSPLGDFARIPESQYSKIYDMVCEKNMVPKRRVPLWFMVKVLWTMWQKEEWFPSSGRPADV
jgi:hypothetical protein